MEFLLFVAALSFADAGHVPAKAARVLGGSSLLSVLHRLATYVFFGYGFYIFSWWVPLVAVAVSFFTGSFITMRVLFIYRRHVACVIISWLLMAATVLSASA